MEFQVRVRTISSPSRKAEAAVPARGPLSAESLGILARLRALSTKLADSLEQALIDLNDGTRLTYIGPVGEAREVMRAAAQMLAPESEIRKQSWFVGVKQGDKTNPSQAERLRYAVQRRGGDFATAVDTADVVDAKIGRLGRLVYQRASAGFHTENEQREARVIIGYVFALLDDILPG